MASTQLEKTAAAGGRSSKNALPTAASEWRAVLTAREASRNEPGPAASARTVAGGDLLNIAQAAETYAGAIGMPPDMAFGLLREGLSLDPANLAKASVKQIDDALSAAAKNRRFDSAKGRLAQARRLLERAKAEQTPIDQALKLSGRSGTIKSILAERNIQTLAAMKSLDGWRALDAISQMAGPEAKNQLASHIELSVVEPDADKRQQLIDAGYSSIEGISRASTKDFVQALAPKAGWLAPLTWQAAARSMTDYASARIVDARMDQTLAKNQTGPVTGKSFSDWLGRARRHTLLLSGLRGGHQSACLPCRSAELLRAERKARLGFR